jgi:hypothetical protein
MAGIRTDPALGLIGALFREGSATGMTDEQLLERFVSQRDAAAEHAFEAPVQRHGPMVLGVCRNALGDPHDAEDAFQARRPTSGPPTAGAKPRSSSASRSRHPLSPKVFPVVTNPCRTSLTVFP